MNIWTAAAEGDLARVQALVESGLSPSIADENTYTPLHASASWSHPSIFSYLVSKGGDPNVTDEDGETPLFVVETAEMARVVISLGGQVGWKNGEGLTAAETLEEEYPHISLYLRSLPSTLSLSSLPHPLPFSTSTEETTPTPNGPDLDAPTDSLLAHIQSIMRDSEAGLLTPEETDSKLREVVEMAVKGTVEVGREMAMDEDSEEVLGTRSREEGEDGGRRSKEGPGR